MSTIKREKFNSVDVIGRMIEATGVKNKAQLCRLLGKTAASATKWIERNSIPNDVVRLAAMTANVRQEWIETGEGPMRDDQAVAPIQPELVNETDGEYSPKEVVIINLMRGLGGEDERDKLFEDFLTAYMQRKRH